MNDRQKRGSGSELLLSHCRSLDPEAPTARERLEDVLGPELARKLIFALAPHAVHVRRAAA